MRVRKGVGSGIVLITMLWAWPSIGLGFERQIKIGGLIQNDWSAGEGDDGLRALVGELEDGTEFRRARLWVSGKVHERIAYKAQYDFASGVPSFKDVYIELIGIPALGGLRVGQFKEPFSFEELISGSQISVLEHSVAHAFTPSHNTGIALFNTWEDQRITATAGVFREDDGFGKSTGDGEYNFTARLTGLPWFDDGKGLVHFGAAVSRRDPADDMVRYSQRPSQHLAPRFVDTRAIAGVDAAVLAGFEFAAVYGPVPIQAEYLSSHLDAPSVDDPSFNGYYIQIGAYLTGEHQAYKKSAAVFDRTQPRSDWASENNGVGAIQVIARFSRVDLSDGIVTGGEMEDIVFGLNWLLNPYARIMVNYMHANLLGVGNADGVSTRIQVDF